MIYFMEPVGGGPIKIGFTDNVDKRRIELESTYNCSLVVLAVKEGGRREESAIHRRFRRQRFGKTEQFRPCTELMEFIGLPAESIDSNSTYVPMIGSKISPPVGLASWLDDIHKKTHIQKTVIIRWALEEWAKKHGHKPPPEL